MNKFIYNCFTYDFFLHVRSFYELNPMFLCEINYLLLIVEIIKMNWNHQNPNKIWKLGII